MKEKRLSQVLVALGVIICVFATWSNYRYNQKLLHKELLEKVQWLKMQDVVTDHSVSKITVTSVHGATESLSSLAKNGARVGVYANRSQCADCWRTVAANMQDICQTYHITNPFILLDGFRPADRRIMANESDSLKMEFFFMNDCEDPYLHKLSMMGKPYVFLLNPDSTMSSVMYYCDAIVPVMKEFLKSFSVDSLSLGHLTIDEPHIQLGTIACRKEFRLHYIIRNNSRNVCKIVKVVPSCTCIEIENNLKRIEPGETVNFDVVFFSDVLGLFMREIELYTDSRSEPYILSIEGNSQ